MVMRFLLIRFLLRTCLRLLCGLHIAPATASMAKTKGSGKVIAFNHVSFLDPLVAYALCDDEPVFAVDCTMAELWWVRPAVALVSAHTIDPFRPFALRSLVAAARRGRTVIIFPEGRLTVTGGLMKIYPGAAYLALKAHVPVVPVHVSGFEETKLTRLQKGLLARRLLPRLSVRFGDPVEFAASAGRVGRTQRALASSILERALERLASYERLAGGNLWDQFLRETNRPGGTRLIVEDRPVEGGWTLRRLAHEAKAKARRIDAEPAASSIDAISADRHGVALILAMLAHARVPWRCGEPLSAIPHRELESSLQDIAQLHARLRLTRRDKVFCTLPPASRAGIVGGVLWPLLAGAGLYLAGDVSGSRLIADCIYVANVTILIGDDATLAGLGAAADRFDFHAVRAVVVWGPVTQSTRRLYADKFGLGLIELQFDGPGRLCGMHGPGLRLSDEPRMVLQDADQAA